MIAINIVDFECFSVRGFHTCFHLWEDGVNHARREGKQEIIDLLKRGKSPEEIIRDYNNELTELVNATEKPPRRNQ